MDADASLDAAVGSVAQEATKLLEALGRSAAAGNPAAAPSAGGPPPPPGTTNPDAHSTQGATDPSDSTAAPGEHVHVAMGDAQTCTWCPLCRSVTALRAVSPETLARLADLATTAATVFADLASRHTETSSEAAGPAGAPADRSTRTEPIHVVDEEEPS